jgi:DNA-binding transcriptional MerR regulator
MNTKENDPLLSISQLKGLCQVSTRKIRHYVSIGLINQVKVTSGSKKYFKDTSIQELKLIGNLRELGFSLDEIGIIMNKHLINTIDFRQRLTNRDKENIIRKFEHLALLTKELEGYFKCLR